MEIVPWTRCECGKMHVTTYVTNRSTCVCGRLIKPQIKIVSTNRR